MSSSHQSAIERLKQNRTAWFERENIDKMIKAGPAVQKRFGEVFARNKIGKLKEEDFRMFLTLEHNQHWSGLHRHAPKMCADMKLLRRTLGNLMYGKAPITKRVDDAVAKIDGMGKAVATALLHVVFPDKYGVWNQTSESAIKELEIWPRFDRGTTLGARYIVLNDLLKQTAAELGIDLWALDALWWSVLVKNPKSETPPPTDDNDDPEQLFALEAHLQDFLWENWEKTPLGKDWERYTEPGEPKAGYEYSCGVGRIDILAKHRKKPQWLVIELKRDKSSDKTVGQVLRYMGWVRGNLVEKGETVRGLIIAHKPETGLLYALEGLTDVGLKIYEVNFHLKEPQAPGK